MIAPSSREGTISDADELGKLDALRRAGVSSQEGFDAEKAKLLAGILPSAAASLPQAGGTVAPQGEGWWQASDGRWYSPEPSSSIAGSPPGLTGPGRQTSGNAPSAQGTDELHTNPSLLVRIGITLVVVIAAFGAFFFVKGSSSKARSENITAAESNLQTAFTGAKTYFEAANQTYTGVLNSTTVSNINEVDTGVAFLPGSNASTSSDTISVGESGGTVLVLTAYAPAAGSCFGIVDVVSDSGLPAWLTGISVGTYFFQIHQANAGSCSATAVTTSGTTLYVSGWQ